MMGWLNKTMNSLGIPLELPTVQEVNGVIASSGWTPGDHLKEAFETTTPPRPDSWATKVGILRYAPSAVSLDKQWTAGVPDTWPAVGAYLRERTGHDFPVLSHLRNKRAVRAIATMIRDNLGESVIGRDRKLSAGLIYADAVGSRALSADLHALGARPLPDSRRSSRSHHRAKPDSRRRFSGRIELRHPARRNRGDRHLRRAPTDVASTEAGSAGAGSD